jgi:hypothetical protein
MDPISYLKHSPPIIENSFVHLKTLYILMDKSLYCEVNQPVELVVAKFEYTPDDNCMFVEENRVKETFHNFLIPKIITRKKFGQFPKYNFSIPLEIRNYFISMRFQYQQLSLDGEQLFRFEGLESSLNICNDKITLYGDGIGSVLKHEFINDLQRKFQINFFFLNSMQDLTRLNTSVANIGDLVIFNNRQVYQIKAFQQYATYPVEIREAPDSYKHFFRYLQSEPEIASCIVSYLNGQFNEYDDVPIRIYKQKQIYTINLKGNLTYFKNRFLNNVGAI